MEATAAASAVRNSLSITAWLSAVHLLGVTLVGGGALVAGLRFGGLIFAAQPLAAIARPAGRAILAGLVISIATGLLLVSPRASASAANGFFQLKMASLAAAAACDLVLRRRGARAASPAWAAAGVARSILYGLVVAAGCAYILLE